jgi:GNAT superfamily N-acetyltransferase
VEVIETARYRIVLQPDYPVAGPNSVTFIRCRPEEADEVIADVRSIVAPRHLPLMWTLDPETEPADFATHLERHGVLPDPDGPEAAVMVLPVDAQLEPVAVDGLEMHDALRDTEIFRRADGVNAEVFGSRAVDDAPEVIASQERRRRNWLDSGNRRLVLATVHGEAAGSAGLTLYPPDGATINGGAVMPEFRGRGVYREMVRVRLEMAREAGVPGLAVWGGHMSAPILSRLGFEKVGWRKFYK